MHHLTQALAGYFKAPAPRKPTDPAYAEFRAYCSERGLTYKIARDGFIEFSDGMMFGHYGDWAETLSGHKGVTA